MGMIVNLLFAVHLYGQQPDFTTVTCPSSGSITVTVTVPGSGGPYTYRLDGCGASLTASGQPGTYTFTGIPNRACWSDITVTDNAGISRTRNNVYMSNILPPGVARVYTYPCGPGNYVIIPIGGLFAGNNVLYRIYAADGTTLIAGPQTTNLFPFISGNAGDVFVVSIEKPCHSTSTIPVTLGTSTTINANVYCACVLGTPGGCGIGTEADIIDGASYSWTSPTGAVYTGAFVGAPAILENNGTWQLTTRITTGACTYDLTSTRQLMGCISSGTVPIRYNYVRTRAANCKLWLQWSTAQQEQAERFEIECSDNGKTEWETVATVPAAGDWHTDREYEVEIPPGPRRYRYIRIRQVDKDEHFNYSSVLKGSFDCRDQKNQLTIAPNPARQNEKITFSFESSMISGMAMLQLTDYTGRIYPGKIIRINRGFNQFELSLSNLPKGLYLLQLKDTGGNWHSPASTFIVQ